MSDAGKSMKDGATKVADDAASAAKKLNDHALDHVTGGGGGSDSKVMHMGEGAYQSASAVMAATTSYNTDCEDGKWHDCYKRAGDYLDHAPPGHYGRGGGGDKNHLEELLKGAASPASCGFGLLVVV